MPRPADVAETNANLPAFPGPGGSGLTKLELLSGLMLQGLLAASTVEDSKALAVEAQEAARNLLIALEE